VFHIDARVNIVLEYSVVLNISLKPMESPAQDVF